MVTKMNTITKNDKSHKAILIKRVGLVNFYLHFGETDRHTRTRIHRAPRSLGNYGKNAVDKIHPLAFDVAQRR